MSDKENRILTKHNENTVIGQAGGDPVEFWMGAWPANGRLPNAYKVHWDLTEGELPGGLELRGLGNNDNKYYNDKAHIIGQVDKEATVGDYPIKIRARFLTQTSRPVRHGTATLDMVVNVTEASKEESPETTEERPVIREELDISDGGGVLAPQPKATGAADNMAEKSIAPMIATAKPVQLNTDGDAQLATVMTLVDLAANDVAKIPNTNGNTVVIVQADAAATITVSPMGKNRSIGYAPYDIDIPVGIVPLGLFDMGIYNDGDFQLHITAQGAVKIAAIDVRKS